MRAAHVMANLRVADVETAKAFYTDYLGLSTEEFNMGWVARYASRDTGANVQLVTHDATAPEDAAISVLTDDIQGAYEEAQRLGYQASTHNGFVPATSGKGISQRAEAGARWAGRRVPAL